jgi:hypothetical protein
VGTRIAFPAEALQQDPRIVQDPDSFDGLRFVKLAAADAREDDGVNLWNASHCTQSNLGYDFRACYAYPDLESETY